MSNSKRPNTKSTNQAKESVSTKNTSCNQTTTDLSMETKPLSQRKSVVQEKQNRVFEITPKSFHTSNTNKEIKDKSESFSNFYQKSMNRKPNVKDLIDKDEENQKKMNEDKTSKPIIQCSTAPAPLPNNFRRVPAMIQSLTKQEEFLKRARLTSDRGRSESSH